MSTGAIIGIVVGGIVVVGAAIGITYVVLKDKEVEASAYAPAIPPTALAAAQPNNDGAIAAQGIKTAGEIINTVLSNLLAG